MPAPTNSKIAATMVLEPPRQAAVKKPPISKSLRAEGIEQKADDHRVDHDVTRNARYFEFLLLVGVRFLCHETPISADAEQNAHVMLCYSKV